MYPPFPQFQQLVGKLHFSIEYSVWLRMGAPIIVYCFLIPTTDFVLKRHYTTQTFVLNTVATHRIRTLQKHCCIPSLQHGKHQINRIQLLVSEKKKEKYPKSYRGLTSPAAVLKGLLLIKSRLVLSSQ